MIWHTRYQAEAQCESRNERMKQCTREGDVKVLLSGEPVVLCKFHVARARKRGCDVEEVGAAPGRRRPLKKQHRLWRIAMRAEVLREEGRIP